MIEVACGTDDAYAPHCATMLRSLFENNPGESLRVHVLHDSALTPEARTGLREAVSDAAPLSFIEVPAAEIVRFPQKRFHVSCWYRVLLGELLPAVERVLYLDADLLVLAPIRELWETDLGGAAFGAVVNPLYPFMPDRPLAELGLQSRRDYLNSGVLLLDLDRMRCERIAERVIEYGRAHPDNPWPEQDALSVVCRGRWRPLHPRWNVQTTFYDLSAAELPLERAEVEEAVRSPAIVHFIGPLKPWTYLCRHPLRHRYAHYRAQTRWAEFELTGRTLGNRLRRPLSLHRQVQLQQLALALKRMVRAAVQTLRSALRATGITRWRAARALRDPLLGFFGLGGAARGPRVMTAFASIYPTASFVQIGSNDGKKHDPLHRALVESRWSGVMVEPVRYVFERLRKNYLGFPRLQLENLAIASQPGSLPFYHLARADDAAQLPSWYDELGSFRKDVVLSHRTQIPDIEHRLVCTHVECVTFAQLCERHRLDTIDLLHIDTEGYDFEILKTIDFALRRPLLLIFEHKHLSAADRLACEAKLRASGYLLFSESADTWCIDSRMRDARHRRLLRKWRRITGVVE